MAVAQRMSIRIQKMMAVPAEEGLGIAEMIWTKTTIIVQGEAQAENQVYSSESA